MSKVLLVYATKHGHTAKIAARMAEAVRAAGREVDLRSVEQVGDADPGDYDGTIVGASLHQGHHQREVVDWVRHHHLALEGRPSAFFSVSLTAAEDTDEARAATRECTDAFLEDSGWSPTRSVAIAGALQWREYDVFTRVLMRLIVRRKGQEVDVSHDHEYTDWEAVERFARQFAEDVSGTGRA